MIINPVYYQQKIINPETNKNYNYIVLDTSKSIDKLRKQITHLNEVDSDEDKILEIVFQSLAYKHLAKRELEYNCLDIVSQYYGTIYSNDFIRIAEAVASFGKEIYSELIRLNIYTNNYLFYQYIRKVGKDILLGKLVVPDIRHIPNFPKEFYE